MSALTAYIIALIDVQNGRITATDLRQRWKAGEFKGVRTDWATAYAKLHNVGNR